MAERTEPPKATRDEPRPIEEAELDEVAGGKRSNVKDAHDKYANIEVDYTGGRR